LKVTLSFDITFKGFELRGYKAFSKAFTSTI
jgi:hypothetical protein